MSGCGGTKQAAQASGGGQTQTDKRSQIQAMEEEAKLIAAQVELDKIKFEAEQAAKDREAEAELRRKQREYDADQSAKLTEIMEVQLIKTPCIEKLLDTEGGKYITGFASSGDPSNDMFDEDEARRDALVRARNYIGEKFMGIAKNFAEEYKKSTTVPGGAKKSEGDFERIVQTAGKKVVDKWLEETCDKMTKTERGTYRCYKAVRIPVGKLLEEVARESAVQGVQVNKQVARNTMDKILDEAEQGKNREAQQAVQQLQQLQQK
jgi:hypothetical protein